MIVTGIAPSQATARTRAKPPEEKRAEAQRTGFSARHVILDLSRDAMQRIGYEPDTSGRSPQPPLFVYTGKGAFAYDEAARRYEEAQQRALSRLNRAAHLSESKTRETEESVSDAPLPSTVAFDGMLGV